MYKLAIRGIEVYHGSKVVDNSYYIEHFKARGKDVEHFLRDVVGRDNVI
jgi:3-oxoacyl-[acyl-carrier-protein] synthase-3